VYGVAVLSPRIILWTVVIVGVLLAAITVTVGVWIFLSRCPKCGEPRF
jgi:hypothetical protein